jgi:hypothetical protein
LQLKLRKKGNNADGNLGKPLH